MLVVGASAEGLSMYNDHPLHLAPREIWGYSEEAVHFPFNSLTMPSVCLLTGGYHQSPTNRVDFMFAVTSLLMRSNTPLRLIVVTTEEESAWVDLFLQHRHYRLDLIVQVVVINEPLVASWLQQVQAPLTDYLEQAVFFLPQVLPSTLERIIVLDTKALVGQPLHLLWQRFALFDTDTVLAMTPENGSLCEEEGCLRRDAAALTQAPLLEDLEFDAMEGNSGLLLLDLARMRLHDWFAGSAFLTEALRRHTGSMFNAMTSYVGVQWLPKQWLVSVCDREEQPIWGIVQFNCEGGRALLQEGACQFRQTWDAVQTQLQHHMRLA